MNARPTFAFDFDGVIADSAPTYVQAINKVGRQLGATQQMNTQILAAMPEYLHHRSAELIGLPSAQLASFSAGLREAFHQHRQVVLHSAMGPVLSTLQSLGSVVVVSANEQAVIASALAQLGVSVQGIHAGKGREGKAAVLAELARRSRVVMVGDTLSDCQAAAAASVDCVAVSWGWQGRALLAGAGVPVLHSSELLEEWLRQWALPSSL